MIGEYQIISVEKGVTKIQICKKGRRDDSIHVRRTESLVSEKYILDAIAYNLHTLAPGILPDDFSTKVPKFEKNAISIGEWHFLDTSILPSHPSIFSTNYTQTYLPSHVCCICFELIYKHPRDKTFIAFALDDERLKDKVNDCLDDNPHKSLFFANIIDMFYKLVFDPMIQFVFNLSYSMYRATPDAYKTAVYDFTSVDEYIASYPFVVRPDESCKYKYPIIDMLFERFEVYVRSLDEPLVSRKVCQPYGGASAIFTHIVTHYSLTFEPATFETLMSWAVINDENFLAKLEARAKEKERIAKLHEGETPAERKARRNEMDFRDPEYSSSDDN